MPNRLNPTLPRGIVTPQDAADYARTNFQNVADALAAPIVQNWGTLTAAQTLDIQVADVNVVTLGANVALTLSTTRVPDRTTVRQFVAQDAVGSRLVTSWTGVTWLNGVTPTLRTTASAYDLFEFTYVQSLNTWVGRYLTMYVVSVPGSLAVTGLITTGTASSAGGMIVNGPAGTNRGVLFYTAGNNRWYLYESLTAEGGANAGSNFILSRYDDAGAYLGDALVVTRSSGAIAVGGTADVQGASGFALGAIAGRRRIQSTGAEGFNLLGDSNAYASLDLLYLAAGTTPATAGHIRVPSQGTVQARNSGNSANVQLLTLDSADEVRIGQSGNAILLAGRAHTLAGSSGTFAQIGGQTFQHFADAGNSGTAETDLYSDSIAASTLSTNGDRLTVVYGGTMVSSATATRQIRVYFGGTLIFDSGTLSLGANTDWAMDIELVRVSSSVVRAIARMNTNSAALVAYAKYTEVTGLTLSNANTLKVTGQAAGVGAASNDIVAKLGTVEWGAAA